MYSEALQVVNADPADEICDGSIIQPAQELSDVVVQFFETYQPSGQTLQAGKTMNSQL